MATRGALAPGDLVLLIDAKGRRRLVRLEAGDEYHSHRGILDHDAMIGRSDGSRALTDGGATYTVVRPTLGDYVLHMRRGAQVIYPKDLGPMLVLADVFPGARVLESGVGSGALSLFLLRAGAEVTGYEIRQDFAARAMTNVEDWPDAGVERYHVEIRDCYEGIAETDLDRVVLDLPEPWHVVGPAEGALRTGGILLAYTPSIVQATRLREALDASAFAQAETVEYLRRTWHVAGAAVRPDHRMVAHTGFLTHARLHVDETSGA